MDFNKKIKALLQKLYSISIVIGKNIYRFFAEIYININFILNKNHTIKKIYESTINDKKQILKTLQDDNRELKSKYNYICKEISSVKNLISETDKKIILCEKDLIK